MRPAGLAGWRIAVRLLWAAILWSSASRVGGWREGSEGAWGDRLSPLLLAIVAFAILQATSRLAGAARRVEASICYGHKNSGLALMLTIDLALPFVVAALVAYSLVQNLFFSLVDRGSERRATGV